MGSELRRDALLSSVMERFDGRCPPHQSMTSNFGSPLSTVISVLSGGGGGGCTMSWCCGCLCCGGLVSCDFFQYHGVVYQSSSRRP